MSDLNRRHFLKKSALATASLGLVGPVSKVLAAASNEPLFKISLAEWSLNPLLFSGKMDHLNFARDARAHGIEAIEYVNQFFKDKAEDNAYLREMKSRADGEGVRSVLIMCDGEGQLGSPDDAKRTEAVENHYKWVTAAKYLGCHTIRVNGYSEGSEKEQQKLVADGLHRVCEYADAYDISVVIENHGGYSSDGAWLANTIKMADHPRAGTLPDFGNFRMTKNKTYDSYRGIKELMPYATGVSVKPRVFDDNGNESDLDYARMMQVVLDADFHGYCGIEHGPKGDEWTGIMKVKHDLIEVRDQLMGTR
jgi:sugar phosphate isomerase/epimerase